MDLSARASDIIRFLLQRRAVAATTTRAAAMAAACTRAATYIHLTSPMRSPIIPMFRSADQTHCRAALGRRGDGASLLLLEKPIHAQILSCACSLLICHVV